MSSAGVSVSKEIDVLRQRAKRLVVGDERLSVKGSRALALRRVGQFLDGLGLHKQDLGQHTQKLWNSGCILDDGLNQGARGLNVFEGELMFASCIPYASLQGKCVSEVFGKLEYFRLFPMQFRKAFNGLVEQRCTLP